MDWILPWCVLLATLGWLLPRAPRPRMPFAVVAVAACATLAAVQLAAAPGARARAIATKAFERVLPRRGLPDYASSDACLGCHPSEYASWHRSFHRTMTQVASHDAVRGSFDGETFTDASRAYRLVERDGTFWVDVEGEGERRVTMVTGSHHMQAYWYASGAGNTQQELPFSYLLDERRWVPRRDVFLMSPAYPKTPSVWNDSCIECHATAGEPRLDDARPKTRVEELGIACEACHGPGRAHVEANASPVRRALVRAAGGRDATIVNPARLPAAASSQVCGQCHGIACKLEGWHVDGVAYHPGEDLERAKPIVRLSGIATSPCKRFIDREEAFAESRFWSDGEVRVSGREHNALIESACFKSGRLACTSCHSMHASDPDDQLARGMEGNGACASCHPDAREGTTAHTHHAEGSAGSLCYNCHMPYTTYGLLKAIRSHKITVPRVEATIATGRPNACNLCHLDKSLGWTADTLAAWYGLPRPALDADARAIAASVRDALAGDAGQRALAAWSMGWKDAQAASGTDWLAPYLADLLVDRYAAVRRLAARSLASLPDYRDITYDFVGPPAARAAIANEVAARWRRRALPRGRAAVLLTSAGEPDDAEWNRLAAARDDRDMFLAE